MIAGRLDSKLRLGVYLYSDSQRMKLVSSNTYATVFLNKKLI
ncbi:hypothetical protein [Romboutsia maritimum]|nr:hypothetical protein [Romboutsia maritimum]